MAYLISFIVIHLTLGVLSVYVPPANPADITGIQIDVKQGKASFSSICMSSLLYAFVGMFSLRMNIPVMIVWGVIWLISG